MRAYIYQKFYEFNLHIEQGVMLLREMAEVKKTGTEEVQRYADYFEEIRTIACGHLGSIFSDQEEREAGRAFCKTAPARDGRRSTAWQPTGGGKRKKANEENQGKSENSKEAC